MIEIVLYYRKTPRHKWLCYGHARDMKDAIRQMYHCQQDAPAWEFAHKRIEYTGEYPDDLPANDNTLTPAPMLDLDMARSMVNFIDSGVMSLIPFKNLSAAVMLGLLDTASTAER